MRLTRRAFTGGATAATTFAITGRAVAQEVTLNAVHFTPAQVSYAQSFLKFVAKVNEAGKGVVQIKVRGGPEVTPFAQLGDAQKNGLVDMLNAPFGAYLNMMPEGEVLATTTKTPAEYRANGGFDLINEIFAKKANGIMLAHVDGGAGFHIFTVDAPPMTSDGNIDFKKLKVRSAPLQRDFLDSLGATVIVQGPAEVYTSLERGLVTSTAYTVAGFQAFGWDKFVKYRIDPSFFQTDVLITMNRAKWDSLPAPAKKILQDVALAHEKESIAANQKLTVEEGQQMIAKGMKVVVMPDAQKADYLAKASASSWARIEKRDPTNVPALKAKFQ